ncbi:tripartite motif-containing protein 2-like [Ptychodera flava]|uniref:tripartite motif-containing protein 2-like n=1 Tax=Ptychodera flava TaxID=63121 RepID=UPI003969EFDB
MASKESAFLEEFNEKFLVCSICSERYKNAKTLPCQHSFCEACLIQLVSKIGKLDCPMCRRSCELPDGGVANLPTNFELNQMVEQFEKRDTALPDVTTYGSCDHNDGTRHCMECDVSLGVGSVSGHGKMKVTRSQRLMAIDKYEGSKSKSAIFIQSKAYCHTHGDNPVEFYCDSCDTLICTECSVTDHPKTTHSYRFLDEAAEKCKRSLQRIINDLRRKELDVVESTTAAEQVDESLDRHLREERVAIQEHARQQIQEYARLQKENETQLLEQLDEAYNEWKSTLQAQLKEVKLVKEMLAAVRDSAENLIQYGSNTQVMETMKGLTAQMKDIMNVVTKREPAVDAYIKFIRNDEPTDVKRLGTLLTARYKLALAERFPRIGEDIKVVVLMTSPNIKSAVGKSDITVVTKTPDNSKGEVIITESKNGNFLLSCETNAVGRYELHVSIYNAAVEESPVNINVLPLRRLLARFCSKGSGIGQVDSPLGVIVTKRNDLVICDKENKRLLVFRLDQMLHGEMQAKSVDIGIQPRLAAEAKIGNILIWSFNRNTVFIYDANYKIKGSFGGDQMKWPSGIAVNPTDGRIYVADSKAHKIHVYSRYYTYIKSFGEEGNGNG